jgi:hypothetical protein
MNVARKFVFVSCLCALLLTAGCDQFSHKKKPTIPPRAQAPMIPLNLPDAIPEPPVPPPSVVAEEEPKPVETKPPVKTHRRNNVPKKAVPGTTPAAPPVNAQTNSSSGTAAVATNHSPEPAPAPNTAVAADVTVDTAFKDKQTTAELLDSAEKIIKGLDDHSLSDDQKAMILQIWSFIAQSRKATIDGDLERALNLAIKAHLLSDALVKK